MNSKWSDALHSSQAAALTPEQSLDELNRYVCASDNQLSALSDHVVYEISGADAQSFLQGQFCNDLAMVSPEQAQITGYCTPKGRLLALPIIIGFDAGYRLVVPADIAGAFIKRLTMFVMRSDVTISLLDDWAVVGFTASANGATDDIVSKIGPLPQSELAVTTHAEAQLVRWHDDLSGEAARARYLRLGTVESQLELWAGLEHTDKSSGNTWRLSDISAGIPSITQGVLEAFVPQMINLQLINGLSFKKGCYPGQEIVARMQYLGKLKRHMRVFSLALDASFDREAHLKAGATLTSDADENAGIVVDALPAGNGTALVLAVTKVTADDKQFSLAGAALTPRAMSYELPSMDLATG